MAEFNKDYLETFLGSLRKYMQIRGGLTQKDLAEKTGLGVSTLSRFINRKTTELSPELIGKIVAALDIPMHEIIDFVEEDFTEKFVRLVKFYKDEFFGEENEAAALGVGEEKKIGLNRRKTDRDPEAIKSATAKVSAGGGPRRSLPFGMGEGLNDENDFLERLKGLSPRQRAYIVEFLNLDMEGRDLIVDLGNNLFRYFRQKGLDLK